jgi:hypothetical protein
MDKITLILAIVLISCNKEDIKPEIKSQARQFSITKLMRTYRIGCDMYESYGTNTYQITEQGDTILAICDLSLKIIPIKDCYMSTPYTEGDK